MKYYLFAGLILLVSCSKSKKNDRPVWYLTIPNDTINLKLTYFGDTTIGSFDAVFAYANTHTDTLTGINNRTPGTEYLWKIPYSSGVHSYTVMRWESNNWRPISSGNVNH